MYLIRTDGSSMAVDDGPFTITDGVCIFVSDGEPVVITDAAALFDADSECVASWT